MSEIDRRASVDFDPVPLRQGRARGFDPAVIGVLVITIALLLAIVKPWAGHATAGVAGVASSASPRSAAPHAPSAGSVPDPVGAATDQAIAARYLSVLRWRDSWGIRAVIAAPGHPDLAERWVAVETRRRIGSPFATTRLDASGSRVLALGVTTPGDATPLAIRVWRAGDDGELTWLDARRVASDLPAGELLLLPPTTDGVTEDQWPAGDYRIDLLMGTRIESLHVRLARPAVAQRPSPRTSPRLPALAREAMPPAWLENTPAGVFAVVGWVVVPLSGEPGPTLGAAEVWLEGTSGGHLDPDRERHVGSIARAGASGLGVVLPTGARDASGVLRRLTPEPGPDAQPGSDSRDVNASNDSIPFLLFRMQDHQAWPAGTYALEAVWVDQGGRRTATWHVEFTPGPPGTATNLLAAARAFGPFAGRHGLLVGDTGQLHDSRRAAGLRPRTIEADPSSARPSHRPIGCDDAYIDERAAVLGLAHPIDRVPSSIEVDVLGPPGPSVVVRPRMVINAVPGLTLLAPGRSATFADGVYRITIHDAAGTRELRVCLGSSRFNG